MEDSPKKFPSQFNISNPTEIVDHQSTEEKSFNPLNNTKLGWGVIKGSPTAETHHGNDNLFQHSTDVKSEEDLEKHIDQPPEEAAIQ